jgi:peptidoglycan/xylan/chitin deacetylase (PgdA/CDA1 family)
MAAGRLSGFPVLMYHGVAPGAGAPATPKADMKSWVLACELRAQLAEIRRAGVRVTGLGETWHSAKAFDGPESPVVLTFDDGQAADYEASFPLLLEAGARADFFVITANIGRSGFLNWRQITEMQRAGMAFQSHGHEHVDLSRLPVHALEHQIRESKQRLEDGLGTAVEFLAAPYGLLDRRVLDVAGEQGYRAVCTSRAWPACPGAPTIGRIAIRRHMRPAGFRRIVTRHPAPYLLRAIRVALIYLPKRVLLRYRPRRLGVRVLEEKA